MDLGKFNVELKDKILIVTTKNGTTKDDLLQHKFMLEGATGHTYEYGLYRNSVGYYAGYDFMLGKSIYCGSLSKSQSIKDIKEYDKNK